MYDIWTSKQGSAPGSRLFLLPLIHISYFVLVLDLILLHHDFFLVVDDGLSRVVLSGQEFCLESCCTYTDMSIHAIKQITVVRMHPFSQRLIHDPTILCDAIGIMSD